MDTCNLFPEESLNASMTVSEVIVNNAFDNFEKLRKECGFDSIMNCGRLFFAN